MPDIERTAEWVTSRLEEVGVATAEGAYSLVSSKAVGKLQAAHVDMETRRELSFSVNNNYPLYLLFGGNPSFVYIIQGQNVMESSGYVASTKIYDDTNAISYVYGSDGKITIVTSSDYLQVNLIGFHPFQIIG